MGGGGGGLMEIKREGRGGGHVRALMTRESREKFCAARIYNAIKRSPQNENFPLELHSASSEKLANNNNKKVILETLRLQKF